MLINNIDGWDEHLDRVGIIWEILRVKAFQNLHKFLGQPGEGFGGNFLRYAAIKGLGDAACHAGNRVAIPTQRNS